MSFEGSTTTTAPPALEETQEVLPLPAIIVIAIGGYVFLIVLILVIRSLLMQKGLCKECCNQCQCCGKEGDPHCCECWVAFADSCNCCKNPNIDACLDSCCPTRKKMDCADIIMCQCCAGGGCCGMCANEEPICDCGNCNLNCNCQPPQCEDLNCLCCQLQPKATDTGVEEEEEY